MKSDEVLLTQAPPWVKERDKNRRKVRNHRRRLTHLMSCFSEEMQTVEKVLQQVIRGTEALIMADLPKDSISFTWVLHPQKRRRTHAHAVVINAVLPAGGLYDPQIDIRLLTLFDRLAGRALGLSDPMDPRRARLIKPCDYSRTPENLPIIALLLNRTNQWYEAGELKTHSDLRTLLKKHKHEFGRMAFSGNLKEFGLREYKSVMAIQGPNGPVCFCGEVLRPDFSAAAWQATLSDREEQMLALRHSGHVLYEEFLQLFHERCREQRATYPVVSSADRAEMKDLEWLDPARRPIAAVEEDNATADQSLAAESEYPFYDGSEYQLPDPDSSSILSTPFAHELEYGNMGQDPSFAAAPRLIYPVRPGYLLPLGRVLVSRKKMRRRKLAMALGIAAARQLGLEPVEREKQDLAQDTNQPSVAAEASESHIHTVEGSTSPRTAMPDLPPEDSSTQTGKPRVQDAPDSASPDRLQSKGPIETVRIPRAKAAPAPLQKPTPVKKSWIEQALGVGRVILDMVKNGLNFNSANTKQAPVNNAQTSTRAAAEHANGKLTPPHQSKTTGSGSAEARQHVGQGAHPHPLAEEKRLEIHSGSTFQPLTSATIPPVLNEGDPHTTRDTSAPEIPPVQPKSAPAEARNKSEPRLRVSREDVEEFKAKQKRTPAISSGSEASQPDGYRGAPPPIDID